MIDYRKLYSKYDEKEFFDKSIKMLEKDYGNNFANDFKDLYIKQQEEIERLNNIIKEALNYIDDNIYYKSHKGNINIDDVYIILQEGSDKE